MPAAKSVEQLQRLTAAEPRNAAAWHDLGNALLEEGKVDRAISMFRRALRIDDDLAEVHNDLGTAYFDKGWHAEAEACFRKAIKARPDHGVAHANLGAALRAQGRLGDSRSAFTQALKLKLRALLPRFLRWKVDAGPAAAADDGAREAFVREMKQLLDAITAGRLREALQLAAALEARYPEEPDAIHLHGVALGENRRLDDALEKAKRAIALHPDRTEYHVSYATLLARAFRHREALEAAAQALRLEPGSAAVVATIAGLYHGWREDLAIELSRRAIGLDPACALAHGNLAVALWNSDRAAEAEQPAREALRLQPTHPSFKANLALVLKDLGRMQEAQELYRALAEEASDYPKVCMDAGTLAMECEGNLESARRWYRKAQAVSSNPRAILCESIIDLLEAKFEDAWPRYEARKQMFEQHPQHALFAGFPAWKGEPLAEGRLLVYGEQGLGDEIMFASMYGDLARRSPNVTLLCEARLGALFSRSFPSFEVHGERKEDLQKRIAALPPMAAAIAAGSVGRYFRNRATDFPAHRGYLRTDPAQVAAWKERLAALGEGAKVGISWIGGTPKTGKSRRSLRLKQLQPLLTASGIKWISLQHTDVSAEISAFGEETGVALTSFSGVTQDIDQLASLIQALDIVVSVCNTTVHVAGALGKEVLVLAPFVPEWRYGIAGERMFWYPSARVYRQTAYGVWDGMVDRVGRDLADLLARRSAANVVDQ